MSLLVVSTNNEQKIVKLPKAFTSLGGSEDYDIYLPEIGNSGFSVLKSENGLKLIPLDNKLKKNFEGPWDKDLNKSEIFKGKEVNISVLPQLNLGESKGVDIDFEKLPLKTSKESYPKELLAYLLESFEIDEGALIHKRGDYLHTLASKNIELKDKSTLFLSHILKENSFQPKQVINFETHSMMFRAGMSTGSFLLLRASILDSDEVLLYIPEPEKKELPEGLLTTLLYLLANSLAQHLLIKFNKKRLRLKKEQENKDLFWGETPKMNRIQKILDRLAPTDISILIHGETGSGKEMLARYVQKKSKNEIFVPVNCAAIPKELAESVLFGHTKGSFTGAHADQKGRIEQANHGILFLDEIGELDLNVQAKLLRFLQDGLVTPIGGKEKKVKIRLVAATHKDLAQEVADGNFREDLYYRLNEAVVTLPPLRERGDDILQLGNLFLAQMIETNDLDDMAFSAEAEKLLKEHSWPGNIRELRSTMRKVAILNDEAFISADFLSSQLGARNNTVKDHFPMNLNQAKKLLIKRQIEKALDLARGNRTQAAKLLDITPRSLFRFLSDKDYDIKVSDPENNVIQ